MLLLHPCVYGRLSIALPSFKAAIDTGYALPRFVEAFLITWP